MVYDLDARPHHFQSERLGMATKHDATRDFGGFRIDHRQRVSVSNVDFSSREIVANVICVLEPIDLRSQSKRVAGKDINSSTATIGNG